MEIVSFALSASRLGRHSAGRRSGMEIRWTSPPSLQTALSKLENKQIELHLVITPTDFDLLKKPHDDLLDAEDEAERAAAEKRA